jgi:hypothetical protein
MRTTAARVAVVLPIKATAGEQVRGLVAKAPPFDLESSGIDEYHVFVTGNEVIFILEASDLSRLRRLVANLDLVAAAERWQQHAAGPARIAEEAFSWSRPDLVEGLSFAPTPGPGDSEGGDLYPP